MKNLLVALPGSLYSLSRLSSESLKGNDINDIPLGYCQDGCEVFDKSEKGRGGVVNVGGAISEMLDIV